MLAGCGVENKAVNLADIPCPALYVIRRSDVMVAVEIELVPLLHLKRESSAITVAPGVLNVNTLLVSPY
jgi:hypothetical protein